MTESDSPRGTLFISYCSADREQANGFRRMFTGLGHEVFQDHVSIRAGKRWEQALHENIAKADICVVLWTKDSAKSEWVRKEYMHFHHNQGQDGGILMPVFGDDTPLDDVLSQYQSPNPPVLGLAKGVGVANELLATGRKMLKDGFSKDDVAEQVSEDLKEAGFDPKKAGIEDNPEEMKKLAVVVIGLDWWGLFKRYAPAALRKLGYMALDKAASYFVPAAAGVGSAALTGALFYFGVFPPRPPPEPSPTPPAPQFSTAWVIQILEYGDSLIAEQPNLDELQRQLDSIRVRLDDLDVGGPTDLSPLMTLLDAGVLSIQTGTLAIRGDLRQTHSALDRIYQILADRTRHGDTVPRAERSGLDSLFTLARRTEVTLGIVYRDLTELRDRDWPDLADFPDFRDRLDSLLAIRAEVEETHQTVDRMFEHMIEVSTGQTLQLKDIERRISKQMAGTRDTLRLISERLTRLFGRTSTGQGLTRGQVRGVVRSELEDPRATLGEVHRLLTQHAGGGPVDTATTMVRMVMFYRGSYSQPPIPVDTALVEVPEDVMARVGTAELAIVAEIDRSGRVAAPATPFPSQSSSELAPWAIRTVNGWEFEPASHNGETRVADLYVAFFLSRPSGR